MSCVSRKHNRVALILKLVHLLQYVDKEGYVQDLDEEMRSSFSEEISEYARESNTALKYTRLLLDKNNAAT